MSFDSQLPVSEFLGVFVGISGYDWLASGHADPVKALAVSFVIASIVFGVRYMQRHRKKLRNSHSQKHSQF